MLDRGTFLSAVRDAPDDDGPRLVYADWLEENGDTTQAEFIRVQCELARLAPRRRGRGRLRARQRQLWTEHRLEWLGPLSERVRIVESVPDDLWEQSYSYNREAFVRFSRGFLELIDLPAELFLRAAADLFRVASPDDLRITGELHRYAARALGNKVAGVLGRELPRARPQSLSLTFCPMAARSWRTLLRSPGLGRLRRLKLAACSLGNDILPILAASPHLRGLTELNLASNPITDEGLLAVAESSRLTSLTVLRINDSRYYEAYSLAGLIELAESPRLPKLAEIHVVGSIGSTQVEFFRRRFGPRVRLIADADDIPF